MSDAPADPDVLARFLEKIHEQNETEVTELDADALRALAIRYGLDADAYGALIRDAEDHHARGLLFFEHGNWDDAIVELEQAYAVIPYRSGIEFTLGKAHACKYRQELEDSDRALAEKYFRQCLERDSSHTGSVRELTDLEQRAKERARFLFRSRAAVVVIALFLFGGSILLFRPVGEPPRGAASERLQEPKAESGRSLPIGPIVLPATFPVAEVSDEFSFESRSSILTRYNGKYSYELRGTILTGAVTISEMRATLELLGENEEVHTAHSFDIQPSHRSVAVAGDSIPLRVLIFEDMAAPEIVEARLTLDLFQHTSFPGVASLGKLLDLVESDVSLPPDCDFEVRERNLIRSRSAFGDDGLALLKLVLTVENTGRREIRSLKIQAAVNSRDGEIIPLVHNRITKHSGDRIPPGEISAVDRIQPPLLVGERRVVEASIHLPDTPPDEIGDYRLELTGVE